MEKDLSMDAVLVHASYIGLFELAAIGLNLTPSEAIARGEWLVKQDDDYITLVANKVKEMVLKQEARHDN